MTQESDMTEEPDTTAEPGPTAEANEAVVDDKEQKPDVSQLIRINVVHDQDTAQFQMKRTTTLKKLMEKWCEDKGKSLNSVRFLCEGQRIMEIQTPQELELEDGDEISVMMEQIGGS